MIPAFLFFCGCYSPLWFDQFAFAMQIKAWGGTCATGPGVKQSACGCLDRFDADHDRDVDLRDFAALLSEPEKECREIPLAGGEPSFCCGLP